MTDANAYLLASIQRLDRWLIDHDYKAYDPFDGLSSYLRPLTFGLRFPQQVLQVAVRRNPFNLRPLLGIKPHVSTKGLAFVAGGYLQLYRATREEAYKKKLEWCLDWLMKNTSPGYPGCCWGNAFDYISRGSDIPKYAPTVVWTGLIGHEFIDAFRELKDERYLHIAKEVGRFILTGLERFEVPNGLCISYVTTRISSGRGCSRNSTKRRGTSSAMTLPPRRSGIVPWPSCRMALGTTERIRCTTGLTTGIPRTTLMPFWDIRSIRGTGSSSRCWRRGCSVTWIIF
jgi:hypothetical protein